MTEASHVSLEYPCGTSIVHPGVATLMYSERGGKMRRHDYKFFRKFCYRVCWLIFTIGLNLVFGGPVASQCLNGAECSEIASHQIEVGLIDDGLQTLLQGCDKGQFDSCYLLLGNAGFFNCRPVIVSWVAYESRSLELSRLACQKDELYACIVFAQLVRDMVGFSGFRGNNDYIFYENMAVDALIKACAGEFVSACTWLASALSTGWGTSVSVDDAVSLWSFSCHSGDSSACYMLDAFARCALKDYVYKTVCRALFTRWGG